MVQTLRKQVAIGLLVIELIATILIQAGQFFVEPNTSTTIAASIAIVIVLGLLFATWRDWEWANRANVLLMTLLIGLAMPMQYVVDDSALLYLVPAALALILAPTNWIWYTTGLVTLIFIIRGEGNSAYTNDIRTIASTLVIIVSMFLARHLAERALANAENNATEAAAQSQRANQQAHELAERANQLEQQNLRQQQLLELVATLETPSVTLADGVLLTPMVGHLDAQRLQRLTDQLLHTIVEQRARLVIIDIAGVPEINAASAQALLETTRAIRLLGCRTALTGISANIALTLTNSGFQSEGVATARSPQEALARFITSLN
jgi:anti-anti-sigma regulatory factor